MTEYKVPTEREERDEKVEYAFQNLLSVTPVLHFVRLKDSCNWLKMLWKREIQHEIRGIYLTRNELFLLVELSRLVMCCGDVAMPQCKIWLRSNIQKDGGFDFLMERITTFAKERN